MIFFDEAGNSGDNLLDLDQPVYTLLSHDFDESEASAILESLRKISGANELHFKSIKRHYKQQIALMGCLRHPSISIDRVFAYSAHKEFMNVCQIVDKLIEHVLYEEGVDIYQGGANISMSNMIFMLGSTVWNRELLKAMCQTFVIWYRSMQKEDGDAFYQAVVNLHKSIKKDDEILFTGLVLASRSDMIDIQDTFEKYGIDATLSCFRSHCLHWSNKYNDPFDITFDHSKQMTHWEGMIEFYKTMPKVEVGYGNRKYNAALPVRSVIQADSKSSIQLQLADILASSITYYYNSVVKDKEDKLADDIVSILEGRIAINTMWPGTSVTPEDLGMTDTNGINPLDFFADHAKKNHELYNRSRPKEKSNKFFFKNALVHDSCTEILLSTDYKSESERK